jgi:hypothetical protein
MKCCSSGKARVYWIIPTKGGLKFKKKGEKKWQTVDADEPLTYTCDPSPSSNTQYLVTGTYIQSFKKGTNTTTSNGTFSAVISGPILGYESFDPNNERIKNMNLLAITPSGNIRVCSPGQINLSSDESISRSYGTPTATRIDNGQDPVKFIIKGTESENIYIYLELPECPDVQTIPCKFDPAKEQFIDVEMSASPNVISCIDIMEADPNPVTGGLGIHIILRKTVIDSQGQPRPPGTQSRGYYYSPKGCPAPKARVECCPNGICGEDKKCPKGTTCELICNGFKCCYSNGKLIRSIKL